MASPVQNYNCYMKDYSSLGFLWSQLSLVHLHHLLYELLITLFDMLHHVSGTSFLFHYNNLISPLTLLFLFLLPSFPLLVFHLFHHPKLPLSFTPGLKPIFDINHSHHRLFSLSLGLTVRFPYCFWHFWDCSLFVFSFFSLFLQSWYSVMVHCGRLSWLCHLSSALYLISYSCVQETACWT